MKSYDVSPSSCGSSSTCRAHMMFSWSTAPAAGVHLTTRLRFCRCALARGWSPYQYTLSLSATQFWSKSVRLHLLGGNSPRSLRHTQRARQNGRSDHILKYPPRLMAAMGITSRSRGSSPGSCAELEPGAACYGYSCSRFSHFAHNSRSFWQESVT